MTSGAQYRLTGELTVPLPPERAFGLFTARGEQAWVDGWEPRFPVPDADDTRPGTVFETGGHDHPTIWLVVDSAPGRRIRYARISPGDRAAIVTVELAPAGDGRSTVTVSYELTALNEAAGQALADFANDYPAYLESWREAIERHLA
jgi:hypothetical protein